VDEYAELAAVYDEWSAPMTDDVAFYADLARDADGPVVELAVGTGGVAVSVAQAIGRPVIGLDTSPAMLEKARESADAAGVELDLRAADMRELTLDEPAALIYCPYRSLLHLPTWSDRRRTFERIAAALQPGGRFAWNTFVFNHHSAAEIDGRARRRLGSDELWELIEHTPADSRIDITVFTGQPGSEPRSITLWWTTKSEWEGLLGVSGLETEALYGWFDRRPFDDESKEFVWVARKPG
jgi:SAM-dependent methyltransferase